MVFVNSLVTVARLVLQLMDVYLTHLQDLKFNCKNDIYYVILGAYLLCFWSNFSFGNHPSSYSDYWEGKIEVRRELGIINVDRCKYSLKEHTIFKRIMK